MLKLNFTSKCTDGPRRGFRSLTNVGSGKESLSLLQGSLKATKNCLEQGLSFSPVVQGEKQGLTQSCPDLADESVGILPGFDLQEDWGWQRLRT